MSDTCFTTSHFFCNFSEFALVLNLTQNHYSAVAVAVQVAFEVSVCILVWFPCHLAWDVGKLSSLCSGSFIYEVFHNFIHRFLYASSNLQPHDD